MAGRGRQGGQNCGRQPGVPNKRTHDARDLLDSLGCNPLEGMARIAMDEDVDIAIRAKLYSELCQYVYPKRRAVEISDDRESFDFLTFLRLVKENHALRQRLGLEADDVPPPPGQPYPIGNPVGEALQRERELKIGGQTVHPENGKDMDSPLRHLVPARASGQIVFQKREQR